MSSDSNRYNWGNINVATGSTIGIDSMYINTHQQQPVRLIESFEQQVHALKDEIIKLKSINKQQTDLIEELGYKPEYF